MESFAPSPPPTLDSDPGFFLVERTHCPLSLNLGARVGPP